LVFFPFFPSYSLSIEGDFNFTQDHWLMSKKEPLATPSVLILTQPGERNSHITGRG